MVDERVHERNENDWGARLLAVLLLELRLRADLSQELMDLLDPLLVQIGGDFVRADRGASSSGLSRMLLELPHENAGGSIQDRFQVFGHQGSTGAKAREVFVSQSHASFGIDGEKPELFQ